MAIWFLTAGLMALLSWALPTLGFGLPASRFLAAGVALTGAVVAVLGVASFRRVRTTVNPLRPATSSTLVVTGIYRISRNPMYLGLLLVLGGWALFLSNAGALLWLPAYILYMNRTQIAAEEEALQARFGPAFAAYRSTVRRWL